MATGGTAAADRRLKKALKSLTAEELVELYLVGDWDVHGAVFSTFQGRPNDALAQGLLLARSRSWRRREAACWLIAVGGRRAPDADQALAKLAEDGVACVAQAAISGLNSLQVGRSMPVHGPRLGRTARTPPFPGLSRCRRSWTSGSWPKLAAIPTPAFG